MHPNLPERNFCILAPSVVDAVISTMMPVHVLNPHCYPVVIREDSMVGQVEPVEGVNTVLRCKNPNERNNISAARRLLLRERSALLNKASRVTEGPESSFVQNIQEPLAPLLENLTELYQDSAEGKTEDKEMVIH